MIYNSRKRSFIVSLFFWLCILGINPNSLVAQDYISFPDSNAIWINEYVEYEIDEWGQLVLASENYSMFCLPGIDTLISSQNYSSLFICGDEYYGALRDEDGLVYFIPRDSINELLIYDFTVGVGDTIEGTYINEYGNIWMQYDLYVFWVDSILINGDYRKRLELEGSHWIEGIGNTNGLFNESFANVSNYFNLLYCMSIDELSLYPTFQTGSCELSVGVDSFINEKQKPNVYPNPSNGKFNIEINDITQFSGLKIFNLLGEEYTIENITLENKITVDLEDFPIGVYFLNFKVGDQSYTMKIFKE